VTHSSSLPRPRAWTSWCWAAGAWAASSGEAAGASEPHTHAARSV
jgi:hypothetical protein